VLVDFENVQPDLSLLANSSYKVKVFFGAKQQEGRVPFKLLDAMLALAGNVEPVKVMRSGSNAVDMHIAYYIGRLIEREPDATIHIISGDTDFDPLAEFLRANGVSCNRSKTIADLTKKSPPVKPPQPRARPAAATARSARPPPPPKAPPPAKRPATDKLAPILKHLHSYSGKPSTRKKLAQTIASYFRQHGGALQDDAVEQLIDELIRLKYVSQAGPKVTYHLS
jgi:PIN domain